MRGGMRKRRLHLRPSCGTPCPERSEWLEHAANRVRDRMRGAQAWPRRARRRRRHGAPP